MTSAGFKMGMKVAASKPTKVSLSKLQMTQRDQKGRSGKKKPRKRDYTEVEIQHDDGDGDGAQRKKGGVSLLEEVKKSLAANSKARQRCNCDGCRRPR